MRREIWVLAAGALCILGCKKSVPNGPSVAVSMAGEDKATIPYARFAEGAALLDVPAVASLGSDTWVGVMAHAGNRRLHISMKAYSPACVRLSLDKAGQPVVTCERKPEPLKIVGVDRIELVTRAAAAAPREPAVQVWVDGAWRAQFSRASWGQFARSLRGRRGGKQYLLRDVVRLFADGKAVTSVRAIAEGAEMEFDPKDLASEASVQFGGRGGVNLKTVDGRKLKNVKRLEIRTDPKQKTRRG